MLPRFFEFLIFESIWKAIEMLATPFLEIASKNLIYFVYLIGAIFIIPIYMFYSYKKNKSKFFAFPITDKILEIFHINTSDFFPEIRSTTLKKHTALAASHCPFKKDINHIYLFEGTPFRYQLVVIGKNTKDFDGVKNYWDRSPSDIFEEHFKEVYHKEPERNLLTDWNVIVVSSLNEIPDDLALKKFKWVLY